jgi:NAD(P)H-flavin reductase
MAPLLSMVRRMAEWQDPQPVRLILGVQTEPEIFGMDQLAQLSLPGGGAGEVTLEKPTDDWAGQVGTAVDLMQRRLQETPTAPDIYLCGSPGFLDAAERTAIECGVPAGQIYMERILAN